MINIKKTERKQQLKYYAGLIIILLVCFFIYFQVKDFAFITYDDDTYITRNPDISDLSIKGVKKILFDPYSPEQMKPPLTVLSLAVNYHFSGTNPSSYHLTNLFLHLINIILVFILIMFLGRNIYAALFVSAIFAFHPSSSESVAWVSSRKELQYAFFYLIALLLVLKYWKSNKLIFYILSIPIFVLSYYSKYAAASFPILYVLLAILYEERKNYLKVLTESIPFFVLPVYSAYLMISGKLKSLEIANKFNFNEENEVATSITTSIQNTNENLAAIVTDYYSFNFFQKLFLGGYSFFQYIIKFVWPFEQQLIYPYPLINTNGYLPSEFYYYSAFSVIIISILAYVFYKHRHLINGIAGFGLLFFISQVLLLLHILPIGGHVVIADRYMYLPIIGLSILMFYALQKLSNHYNKKLLLTGPAMIFIVVLIFQLTDRIPVWKNSETVYTDLVNKDVHSAIPYNNLSNYYQERGHYERSLVLLNKALEVNPVYLEAYYNRGIIYKIKGNYLKSKSDFERVLVSIPDNKFVLYNLGILHQNMLNNDSALYYYERALTSDPEFVLALNKAGLLLMFLKEDFDKAEKYFERALKTNSHLDISLNNMGILYRLYYNDTEKAMEYFKASINENANNPEAYLSIGRIQHENEEFEKAKQTFSYIITTNPNFGEAYFHRGLIEISLGNTQAGCSDIYSAYQLQIQQAEQVYMQYCGE